MANDPHRDLLPVKDIDDRSSRGAYCRADRNVVAKIKRCDLEDRYMRLYDQNTQFKKQINCQDEKIKRLGAKVIRLMSEKKCCTNSNKRVETKGLEELRMRIIELQHENYTLKDRNIVLKQQLASHARQHVAAHRSPNRSLHTSPRISNRQSSAPNVNDSNYIASNRNQPQDAQLREAEEHIHGLNEEIKSLHNKIDVLQQDLEKSCLESQKTKVYENIELIRLQRSLKQQSIQIASLQAHVKNSEKCQKLLRDELAAAHKENEESLQVISDKQKEILDLYTKLEESKVVRLEQEEMKERINDLTAERDSLRERGEFLMKTIEMKSSEHDIVNDLKKLLAVEKAKKEELKQSLENTQKVLQSLKVEDSIKIPQFQSSASDESLPRMKSAEEAYKSTSKLVTVGTQTVIGTQNQFLSFKTPENELKLLASTQLVSFPDGRSHPSELGKEAKKTLKPETRSIGTTVEGLSNLCYFRIYPKEAATQTEHGAESDGYSAEERKIFEAKKLNLERELDYVKQMLRSQTERCTAQDEEINQLKNELRITEEKYNDTLKRLDLHLKIFRHLDSRAGRNVEDVDSEVIEQKYMSLLSKFDENALLETFLQSAAEEEEDQEDMDQKRKISGSPSAANSVITDNIEKSQSEKDVIKDGKMRFIRRKYLDSSDDENNDDDDNEVIKKDDILLRGPEDKDGSGKVDVGRRNIFMRKPKQDEKLIFDSSDSVKKKGEGARPVPKPRTDVLKSAAKTSGMDQKPLRGPKPGKNISISIEWLKLDPDTTLWYNDSVKFLFVDFCFLDVKGEEAETPSSLKKPKKSIEKCFFNFTKDVDINDYRLSNLLSARGRPEAVIIAFKIVSEPADSSDEDECVDVGVAVITAKQFFESNPNTSLLLPVKNVVDLKEKVGILSVRLNISAISEYV